MKPFSVTIQMNPVRQNFHWVLHRIYFLKIYKIKINYNSLKNFLWGVKGFWKCLECNYHNWGHLDKVEQFDSKKITKHSDKVCLSQPAVRKKTMSYLKNKNLMIANVSKKAKFTMRQCFSVRPLNCKETHLFVTSCML